MFSYLGSSYDDDKGDSALITRQREESIYDTDIYCVLRENMMSQEWIAVLPCIEASRPNDHIINDINAASKRIQV